MVLERFSRSMTALFAAVALGLAACASDGTRRDAGEFTSDAALTAKVKTAIATDVGAGTAANINVQSYKGEVQLSGYVSSAEEASKAVQAANSVDGVRVVRNDVRVR